MIPRWILTPGHDSTLNFDPGSEFHVELWPRVMIPRWIMTPGPNFTLNCDPRSGSHFNVKFWSRVTIQRGILTRGHNSTWNSDLSTYFLPVELRLNKVSKFNGAIKIQQLGRVIIQRKIHWIVTPGQYSMGGQPAQTLFKKLNCYYIYKHWSCGTKVKFDLLLLILNFHGTFHQILSMNGRKKSRNYVDGLTRQYPPVSSIGVWQTDWRFNCCRGDINIHNEFHKL